ncbi:MAG: glycosyltransferase family 2 protein [Clostridiales bacterium]|nr:glycosyltransferase family 2 protein [Clostridiales bacterium]
MKVTVFVPVYNAEKYIRQTIKSILNQTFKDFELLIIDDGSTDNTLKIINSFNDDRIRVLKNEFNMGIPFTRNRGLKEALGEYLAIMDSDDIATRDRLKLQVEYLDKHKDIGVVTSSYYQMYKNINFRKCKKIDNDMYIKAYLLFDSYVCNPATMIRMSCLGDTKYNENYFVCEDYDLWVQLCGRGVKFGSITKPLLKYRKGHDNITKKSNKEKRARRNEILLNIRKNQFNNFGFNLQYDDLMVINTFMDYNNRNIDKVDSVIYVLKNIISNNNELGRFNTEILNSVISEIIINQIRICDCSLNEKIKRCNDIMHELNINCKFNFKYNFLKEEIISFVKNKI